MHWNEEIDSTNKIILVQFFGAFQQEALVPIVKQTRLMALALEYKIIFDFRGAHLCLSISDVYYWIPKYYDSLDLRLKIVPTAIIRNKRDKSLFEFMETTFLNKGAKICLFDDEQEARDWHSSNNDPTFNLTCFDRFRTLVQEFSYE